MADKRSIWSWSLSLVALIVLSLLAHLPWLGSVGFASDIGSFEAWALQLAHGSFATFYATTSFVDYPPGYLYILALLDTIAVHLHPLAMNDLLYAMIKWPAILADLLNGVLVALLVRRITPRWSLAAAAGVLFNPAMLFLSANWGQVDAVAATPLLGAVLLIDVVLRSERGATLALLGAWILLAVAVLMKPMPLVLTPLFCVVPFLATSPVLRRSRVIATLGGAFAAVLVAYLLSLPFAPHHDPVATLSWLFERYRLGAGVYPYTSINAFNLYALTPSPFWQSDTTLTMGLTRGTWGLICTLLCNVALLVRLLQRRDTTRWLPTAALTLLATFIFATRMHERYVFDALLLFIPTAALGWPYALGAVALTGTLWLNALYSLAYVAAATAQQTHPTSNGPNLFDLAPLTTHGCALVNVALFLALASRELGWWPAALEANETSDWRRRLRRFGKTLLQRASQPFSWRGGVLRWYDWLLCGGFVALAFAISWYHYAIPHERIFDEIYYARAGNEYLRHIEQYEWTHPPLTKLIIACSMLLFGGLHGGDTSAGWRFLNVVIGALFVGVLFVFLKRLTDSTKTATLGAALLTCDGFRLAQSRIATPEIGVAFFALLTILCFAEYLATPAIRLVRNAVSPTRRVIILAHGIAAIALIPCALAIATRVATHASNVVPWWFAAAVILLYLELGGYLAVRLTLLATGVLTTTATQSSDFGTGMRRLVILSISCGLLAASKWNGLFDLIVIVGYVTLAAAPLITRYRLLDRFGLPWDITLSMLAFVVMSIYGLSYIPYLFLGHDVIDLLALQHAMYAYHYDLRATHPYQSAWWQWPLLERPISYYYHDFRLGAATNNGDACCVAEILALPNPVVWWGGLISVPLVGWLAWKERRRDYALLVTLYLAQWLPWITSPRITFAYHFFPNLALICACDAILLVRLWRLAPPTDLRHLFDDYRHTLVVILVALVPLAFWYWYPITAGMPLSYNAWYSRLWTWSPLWHWV